VTNLPGLDEELTMAGKPLYGVQPIVPTAPGAPLAVGALSWRGRLHFGVTAEPVVLDDTGKMCEAMRDVISELGAAATARDEARSAASGSA
jgi:diacylglycerol O-acyltransferase / wax synthase